MSQLRIENVHASYVKKEVLRGVSLSVQAGEIVAIIGPNGAGKSTLLRVIAGFLKPSAGKIWFNGTELNSLSPHERVLIGLGYFMQGGKVFPDLTVLENLKIATKGTEDERILDVLEVFPNLKSLFNKRAGLLSSGERQALALSLILVKRPNVLLLDEPSAGLSPKLSREMLLRILEINKIWNTAIVLVEQNIRDALNISHQAIMLVSGQVLQETSNPSSWAKSDMFSIYFFSGLSKPENLPINRQRNNISSKQ